MTDGIVIRFLRPSDLHPQMLAGFQHRQVISDKWVKDGNGYKWIKTDEIREWDNDKRFWIPGYLMQQIERGGAAAGAFVNGRMIGFASLDGILMSRPEKYANLTMLFIDNRWQRQGIGKKLFQQICRHAKRKGADRVFISAIPSHDTISFYFSMGCLDAAYIIGEFVDTDYDRYLEYHLK